MSALAALGFGIMIAVGAFVLGLVLISLLRDEGPHD